MKPDICLILENDVRTDGRVLKEAGSLARAGWRVVIVGINDRLAPLPDEEVINGFTVQLVRPGGLPGLKGKLGRALRAFQGFWLVSRRLRQLRARVYHANDFTGLLMLALAGLWTQPFVYDAHELYFERGVKGGRTPTRLLLSLLRPLEGWMARRAAATISTNELRSEWLVEHLRIAPPVNVRNAVELRELGAPVPIQRQPGERLIAHSGLLIQGRNLPELIESLRHLPADVSLALIGDGPLRPALVAQAERLGLAARLRTIYPVTPQTIPPTLAQADAAVVIITAQAVSYYLSLPNKFFEAVAAGVPLVVTDIPEVARLVCEYDLGLVIPAADPVTLAGAIEAILEPAANARYRANALRARQTLNWEAEERALVGLYRRVLGTQ